MILYDALSIPAVNNATANFTATNTDPKASLITTYDFVLELVCFKYAGYSSPNLFQPTIALLLFYDGPNPPAGTFDDFLAIPYLSSNVKTTDFLSVVQASPSNATSGLRWNITQ